MHLKHIPMDGPQNFRDIGGFLNKNGKMIAWNKLYRADGLSLLSEADEEKMQKRNICTIVDLRSISEQEAQPDVVPKGVTYVSCPMMKSEINNNNASEHSFMKSMVAGYQEMIQEGPELIGAAVNAVLLGLQKGSVVFHCTAGKDRTGILACILLMILDAYEEDIVADYQVSYTYNEKGVNGMISNNPKLREYLEAAGEESMIHSNPKNIKAVLKMLSSKPIENWLEEQNVSLDQMKKFRDEMLETI
ncbi:tyrosine-protein phosphatase [Lachnospiraceae bacterium OttesenSCG-928-D06]|nr:tyrosine-protein phosphatase [Lachnospiraceae bacterium OttesenSCG-928-D06]